MALDLATVVKQLNDSGIIANGKLDNFVPPKAHPKSVEELVSELVKQNHLTPFQAQQVKAGKAKALILGAYTVLDKIGAGGMGQVFKAQHRRMDRIVAIKMLPPAMMKDAAAIARFEREVRAAAKLRHTNIVAADDAAEANGVHFLVMEYVDGKDLSALVKKDGPFPVGKAVNYILQAARGLEFAHGEGVVHRDIKPANLLLDKKGVVKILDMGLARIESTGNAATQAELTGTGAVMGTVDYMAPEQALNTKHADQRADIYSLGISLYYLIAGRAAYAGDSLMEKLVAHREQPIPSLQDVQANVPKQLDAVFRKMVAKRIEDRYQSMSDVVEAFEGLGFGGSGTSNKGEAATALTLSAEERKRLASKGTKKPLGSLTEAATSEKTKHLLVKVIGGTFATIIAPVLVTYLIKYLEKDHTPPNSTADTAPAATVPPAAVATSTTPQSTSPATTGGGQASQPWNTLAFQAWMKTIAALPTDNQVNAVAKKLVELNPGFDGKVTPKVENRVVTELTFLTDDVTDISPVRALVGLKVLKCEGSVFTSNGKLSDLSPLQGMKLTKLLCNDTQISDLLPLEGMPLTNLNCDRTKISGLSPLRGMKLTLLNCQNTPLSDLSPLEGMPLTQLICDGTRVSNLSPLKGMPLKDLLCSNTQVSDLSPLLDCMSLNSMSVRNTKVTSAGVAALQKALPNCKIEWNGATNAVADQPNEPWNTPAFQAWMEDVAAMPADKQWEAVAKKLMELNPGFDGVVTPTIANGVITEMRFLSDKVTDISPVRILVGLKTLTCNGSTSIRSTLSDLSPLRGMKLMRLHVYGTYVSDLSPLEGMPLTVLDCNLTQVLNLASLRGMLLTSLYCGGTKIVDLSPLQGMPLTELHFWSTQVSDLSPLRGMKLTTLTCNATPVFDLSPLQDCESLKTLDVKQTKAPPASVAALQKALPNCKIEWDGATDVVAGQPNKPWNTPAFQAWTKQVSAMPAEKQVEAVVKRLQELNPGFDGKVTGFDGMPTPKIENGIVTELKIISDDVTDLSSVRALTGLKALFCSGSGGGNGKLSDLSTLKGMPLTTLDCSFTQVSDLSPLQGMPLTDLTFRHTQVSNLLSLEGMKLTAVQFSDTQISDLSVLKGMPLAMLVCKRTQVSDLSPLTSMQTLRTLGVKGTNVTPATVAALQKALPNCKIEWDDPIK